MVSVPIEHRVFAIERPHSRLLFYYALSSLVLGPLFPVLLIPRYFRYYTLRYRFDDEGVSMRWGLLFRREIHLTYSRIQDIHLRSNIVERWLDLARVEIQTASGSAKAEMTIEGVLEFEEIRDFVYSKMRGFRERWPEGTPPGPVEAPAGPDELTATLREIAREIREIRRAVTSRGEAGPGV